MANINRINILPPSVFNLIAAGEVVERPASALKELVENSIDAGARRIIIEVEEGGFGLISVSDNGCGLYEDDLEAAFMKHATSKLSHPDDLNSIQTLGFRGEALSSIAAVARIKLTTRQAQSDTGVCVTLEEGKIVSKEYVTANVGTKIEVRDLFYNVPARKKFMKSNSKETADIAKFVHKLILTNPNLEITYISDGKVDKQTKGSGLAEAIFTVYGYECLKNCLAINYEGEFLRINGYIGTPEYAKPNSTYQTLSVNGRCISDKNIQGSIARAYQSFLMTRQYPFYVLDLSIPCDMVDVNVHPRKTEVRFQNPNLICGQFYNAVKEALVGFTYNNVDVIFETNNGAAIEDPVKKYDSPLLRNIEEMTPSQIDDVVKIEERTRLDSKMPFDEFADALERSISVQNARRAIGLTDEEGVHQKSASLVVPATQIPITAQIDEDFDLYSRTRFLGALFKTYLMLELDEKLIIIDQHAAHERILFDKFMQGKSSDMQPMMFPYVFKVKDDEAEFIERNIPNILKAGIEVQPFGQNTFRICAVSTLLAETKMDDFVQYLLSSADELEIDDSTLIVERIAKKACRAAAKAGDTLSRPDISFILKSICENKILQCPHGRPITVVFTKAQLEKMFKRTL